MFSLVSGLYQNYFSPVPLQILVVGTKGVGKTTLLERIKVTEFSSRIQTHETQDTRDCTTAEEEEEDGETAARKKTRSSKSPGCSVAGASTYEAPTMTTTTSKRRLACPTPGILYGQKYEKETQQKDDEDEYSDDVENDDTVSASTSSAPLQGVVPVLDARTSSLEDVLLRDDDGEENTTMQAQQEQHHDTAAPPQEFDLQRGAKMLPLDKIRPTIGTNLAKNIRIGPCTCKLFDVGGSMQDLWPQYYNDADAVVYVVGIHPHGDDSIVQQQQQQETLEQVRRHIPDDVPFMVFVHIITTDDSSSLLVSKQRHRHDPSRPTLDELLPHYHNNVMRCFVGSAKTGEGVREAFEWLVGMAKRQVQLRKYSGAGER